MMKTKMTRPTWLEIDQIDGFRVGKAGEVELMTRPEVDAVIACALNEAVKQVRPIRGLKRPH